MRPYPFLLVWAAAVIAALAFVAEAFADDAPPQTEVRICGGTLPATSLLSNHDAPCYEYTITATDRAHPGLLNHNTDDEFRHVYYLGGDPACIFTADYHHETGGFLVDHQDGGRDCNASTPNGQCAYIAQGYAIFAVTGQSCSQASVPICTGLYCI